MNLPERAYYPLSKAAKKLCCDEDDLIHFGSTGELEICLFIEDSFEDYSIKSEPVDVGGETIRVYGVYCSFAAVYLDDKPSKLHFNGMMSISPTILRNIEFYGDSDFDSIYGCTPCENNESVYYFDINTDGVSITKDRLYITADEIYKILSGSVRNNKEKFLISGDSPKTTAKASELIPPILKMIPELSDIDFDNEKVTKIVNIIESVAASKGIELPKTHWQTWKKYIGRD
ncbi:hypothetical protein [Hafnia paralvei]|uniref:hypothetical protein n=1 Tax=Hafnia paralvei TaxID=546367 RepID=UPI003C666DFC